LGMGDIYVSCGKGVALDNGKFSKW